MLDETGDAPGRSQDGALVFLKRIALHGFKSFADRTEFEFGPGVTAIVGPNGCGKSNVLDAVRWVLGEQSARSLRGERMADVVFSGARTRKPSNFAEVQLVFDNRARLLSSDQDEVTVSRTLYRSGDSEYRLNGNLCRLRDIKELLLDTGVGVDAYSVIEQGRVDSLLQSSPVERREIFEEAAGISRYKIRRTEAERKLERTQQNLLRLNDVVDELEKRLRSVKLAAGKARNFQQYDSRLRELRAAFSLAEYHDLEQSRLALEREIEALAADSHARRAELAAGDADAAEQSHAAQRLDEDIRAGEAAVLALQSEASTLSERISQEQRRIEELGALCDRRRAQAEATAGRAAALEERVAADRAALLEASTALESENAACAALREEHAAAGRAAGGERQALDRERSAAFDAARRAALLHSQHAAIETQRAERTQRLRGVHERLAALAQEQQVLAARRIGLAERVAALRETAARIDGQLSDVAAQALLLDEQTREADRTIAARRETRTGLLSRLGMLDQLERRFEGVDQGAQQVLAWRGDAAGDGTVVGLVADCLRIDDPRVDALAAVLAGIEDCLVVRDGSAFVGELRRRSVAGAALRVLALDRIASDVARAAFEGSPGVLARVADWVTCEPEYRAIAEVLLGRVYLVDDLERALALASAAPAGCMFVTAAGETVSSDGRLTFGRPAQAHGLISRKAEIRALRAELDEIETSLEQSARLRADLLTQRGDLDLRRDALAQEAGVAQRQASDAQTEIVRAEDESRRAEREQGNLAAEQIAIEREIQELAARLEALIAEGQVADTARAALEQRVEELQVRVSAAEAAAAELSRGLTARLVDAARAAERHAAAERALAALHESRAALEREQAEAHREADAARGQIAATEDELTRTRARCTEATRECETQRAAVAALRAQRQVLRERIDACSAAIRALHAQIEEVDAALAERQAALREAAVRRETLVARVAEELGLNLADLYAGYQHADQDWAAIRAEIDDLRQKIARLGNVNLDAIAELEELQPRYDNLVAQRSDLLDSSERLRTLIAELDVESKLRFHDCFAKVREHFQELFRKLFGGGRADVILEDPENPLTCGIEIIARPPGKEPQSISLLSGGEKTMTAVAMLLAIFKNKPSPFCILDEVDAALDESNVERFNTVLGDFLAQSQFVVITHHKRTMQSADVLYGVTMEEAGVSKRMSIRFEERVETPVTT